MEKTETHQYTCEEEAARLQGKGRFVIGNPIRVKEQFQQLTTEAQVYELMTVNMITDYQVQLKSNEILAVVLI